MRNRYKRDLNRLVQHPRAPRQSRDLRSPGALNAVFSAADGLPRDPAGTGCIVALPPNRWAIAAGYDFHVAILPDGTLAGWGADEANQVTDVPAGGNYIKVTTQKQHALALACDGTVSTWGYNSHGQLSLPAGLYLDVDTSWWDTVALKDDGTVISVGTDWTGHSSQMPANLGEVKQVACGPENACVLKADGTVVCWGTGAASTPPSYSDIVQISLGDRFGLALRSDGTVVSWGYDHDSGADEVPVGLSDVVSISAGERLSIAVKSDGSVVAWGTDNGPNNIDLTPPPGLSNIIACSAGIVSGMVIDSSGAITNWGGGEKASVTANSPTTAKVFQP